MKQKKTIRKGLVAVLMIVSMWSLTVFASDGETVQPAMYATFWALVPPIVAIGLALITKEVYSSLFIGIVVGGLFASNFHFEGTVNSVLNEGMISVLTSSDNVGIIIFLVVLGVIVSMMNKAGGSAAFGEWAGKRIRTRVGAQLATIALGVLIFIDDYFNCLTVGSVMRPVTDRHKVSRAKLAYLIDATAAPVCIIAPISSWAAAVSSYVEGEDGFSIFIKAIPYNFYALLTIVMMVGLTVMKIEFGSMRVHEKNAIIHRIGCLRASSVAVFTLHAHIPFGDDAIDVTGCHSGRHTAFFAFFLLGVALGWLQINRDPIGPYFNVGTYHMDVFIKDDKLLFSKIGQLIGCDPRFNILGGFWGRHRRRPQRGGAEEAQTQCGYT